jgi:DNA-binding LytR/AlgR family response regulator
MDTLKEKLNHEELMGIHRSIIIQKNALVSLFKVVKKN